MNPGRIPPGTPGAPIPDPRYALSIRELPRRPGSLLEVELTLPAPVELGSEVIGVPEGAPIEARLCLESVSEGVLLTGELSARAEGECVRCLEPVAQDVAASLTELFVYPERSRAAAEAGDDDEEEELRELSGDDIDLEGPLRDALVPVLPFQPLCAEDCPGLCSECGARLADDPGHHHDTVDPRWRALGSLLDQEEAGQ